MNEAIFGKFYSPTKALSYHRPWILSIGTRSIGKSTGWLIKAIGNWCETGQKFIYVRRTDDEIKITAKTACNNSVDILHQNGYNICSIEARNGGFYAKNKAGEKHLCGYYIGLSVEYKHKSSNYSDVKYIIYDEFMATDSSRYLGGVRNPLQEYDNCLELYQTVDRGIGQAARNETIFVFIANIATYYSPIFVGLGVDKYITPESRYIAPKDELWVCEQTKGVPATSEIMNSFAARLGSKKYTAYAYGGDTLLDGGNEFVEESNEPLVPLLHVIYRNTHVGIYRMQKSNKIYFSKKLPTFKPLALSVGDQNGMDYTIIRRPSEYIPIRQIQMNILQGNCQYETRRIKILMITYFNLLPNSDV